MCDLLLCCTRTCTRYSISLLPLPIPSCSTQYTINTGTFSYFIVSARLNLRVQSPLPIEGLSQSQRRTGPVDRAFSCPWFFFFFFLAFVTGHIHSWGFIVGDYGSHERRLGLSWLIRLVQLTNLVMLEMLGWAEMCAEVYFVVTVTQGKYIQVEQTKSYWYMAVWI